MVSTTPWDSYLIYSRIWTYPPNAIVGPTLFSIPAEEIFFFVIQTYNTSLLYLILSKPTFHPVYLRGEKLVHDGRRLRLWRWLGNVIMAALIITGAWMVVAKDKGLYMGLILVWAVPVALMLWYVPNPLGPRIHSDVTQESCVPVHYTTSTINNAPTNRGTDIVFVDGRYAGIETRNLGY